MASSAPCLPLAPAKPPPAAVTGWHLLLLVADARKAPGVRAVQEQEGGDEEQGDAVALARSTSFSEENDSKPLTETLNFLNVTKTVHCRCSTVGFCNEINFSGAVTW